MDSATALLSQSFRDFPDSVTVWDPQQSGNTGSPNGQESATTVTGAYNEGTTLYLHAVPTTASIPNRHVASCQRSYREQSR